MKMSFEPVYDKNSRVLILGSFPSVKSREIQFYYGNKQNKFWRLLEEIFNIGLNSKEDKIEFLLDKKIALWDIIESCDIVGSNDADIKNYQFADIKKILPPFSKVDKILCNGKLAYKLTCEYLKQNQISVEVKYLPSTSPANVRFDKSFWVEELKG